MFVFEHLFEEGARGVKKNASDSVLSVVVVKNAKKRICIFNDQSKQVFFVGKLKNQKKSGLQDVSRESLEVPLS